MELELTANDNAVAVEGTSTIATVVLAVLFFYFFIRHFLLVLMVMDIVTNWLSQFRWFPGEGRRLRGLFHWVIALGLFLGFLAIGNATGILNFIPK